METDRAVVGVASAVYAPERHQQILNRARERGRIEVKELAEELAVTPETVRRDLTALERLGVLRRVHGGAIPVERLPVEPAVNERESVSTAQKQRIAKAALAELPEGGSIILDAGTTTVLLAEQLPTDRELTVVTHSVPVAALVASRPTITLHVLGGRSAAAPSPPSATGPRRPSATCSSTSRSWAPTASPRTAA